MKIRYKLSLPFLLFLFAFQSVSYAATITWTGDVSSEWFNAGNWSGAIPAGGDDVIIPAGRPNDPVIEFLTQIASMVVESGATVTIISATLSINNASGNGLDNSGTINNAATINIQNTTDNGIFNQSGASFTNDGVIFIAGSLSSVGSNGILNEGTGTQFQNNNRIDIRQADANALQNQGGAQFTNAVGATINIGQDTETISGDGIVNSISGTTFTNSGSIVIDKTSGEGLGNQSSFNNTSTGTINIGQNDGNIGQEGIQNSGATATFINEGMIQIDSVGTNGLANEGIFNSQNSGRIEIGLVASIDSIGILNTGTFSNTGAIIEIANTGADGIDNQDTLTNAGVLVIDNTSNRGIFNSNSGVFINDSTINIANTTLDGVNNQNTFHNNTNATINIGQNAGNIGRFGILNVLNTAVFTNEGTIEIDNTSSDGIQNQGTFDNTANATINIGQNDGNIGEDGIQNEFNTAIFTNDGMLTINSTDVNGILNTATFTSQNSGKIEIGLTAAINGIGIRNPGTFNSAGDTIKVFDTRLNGINNGGTFHNLSVLVLEDIGGRGIFNNSGGSFTNDSTINIGTNNLPTGGNGMLNEGAGTNFQNNGTINIEQANDAGILNTQAATLTNSDTAILNIGQNNGSIDGDGVFNTDNATSFINSGTINIDNTDIHGIINQSSANFDNAVNGKLNIGQNYGNINRNGIFTLANFTNSSTILIDKVTRNGVVNEGTFNNAVNAQLNIGQNDGNIVRNGIINVANSIAFTNSGTITIDSTMINGLLNEGTFTNQNDGNIQIGLVAPVNSAGIVNTGTFKQVGDTIKIANTGAAGIDNQDSLTNAGLIVIENTTASGVLNNMGAVFINDSTINIGTNNLPTQENAIQNQGVATDFQNNGTINIERTAINTIAIQNAAKGKFTNSVAAILNIGQNNGSIAEDGIINTDDSTAFFNLGVIHIDNTTDAGIINQLGAAFNNAENAMLKLGQNGGNIGQEGVQNLDITSTFTNEGQILIDSTAANGLVNEGTFNSQNSGSLEIGLVASINDIGILNTGTFSNTGDTIKIANTGADGINNQDTLTNASVIVIENTSARGIFNNTRAAVFINDSMIHIGTNNLPTGGNAIQNQANATFQNNSIINIERANAVGIRNNGGSGFTNAADAIVNIGQNNGSVSIGIFNSDNLASFTNLGIINIDNTLNDGMQNRANFDNATSATLNIGKNDGNIGGEAILNLSLRAIFINDGAIHVDNTTDAGLKNEGGYFENTTTARLNIGQNDGNIGGRGIFSLSNGAIFINEGTTYIDNTNNNGIQNQTGSSCENTITANLYIGQNDGNIDGVGIRNLGHVTFNNSGTIAIDGTAGSGITTEGNAAFNNTSTIKIGQVGTIGARGIRLVNGSSFKNIGGQIDIDNLGNSTSGINIDGSQFIDSTGIIRLGLNHPFSEDAFIITNITNNNTTFTGNDSTTIQCVGDFFIGANSIVSGIRQLELEGDWENNAIFSADSSSVTILGTTQSIIGGSSSTTFFDLTINNSGNIVLENDVTVTRQLSLENGQVNLGDNDFTLGDDYELVAQVGTSALVTNGLGELISTIDNGVSRIFPVGNTNYTPITIQNDGTSDEFSVQCSPEVLEDGISGSAFTNDVVNTTWFIEEAVAGGTNATLTAQWTSAEELSGFDRNSAFLSRYAGTTWEIGDAVSANGSDPYTITRAGVTAFSPFAIGTSFVSDFSCVANDLELDETALASGTYSTQQSIESASLIESGSIVEFIAVNMIELKVGFHAQSGSTFAAIIDDCTLSINENEMIEQRTEIAAQPITRARLLFPNPVGQQLNIRDGIGQAVIYNMLGQEIQAFEIRDELHTVDVSSLASGQYVLLIFRESGERVTLSFVK